MAARRHVFLELGDRNPLTCSVGKLEFDYIARFSIDERRQLHFGTARQIGERSAVFDSRGRNAFKKRKRRVGYRFSVNNRAARELYLHGWIIWALIKQRRNSALMPV